MPASEFGLLLVEGGDELAVCRMLAGPAWDQLCGWKADGRDLPNLARLARNDPNFRFARSVGVILDAESSISQARELAGEALAALGASGPMVHGVLSGSPRLGAFLTPDGASSGAIETLCRGAVRSRNSQRVSTNWSTARGRPTQLIPILASPKTRDGCERTWV